MNEKPYLVPLAEHFHSIQGEGHWVGTPMHFIRVAGCPVGVKATSDFVNFNLGTIPVLESGKRGSKCKTYDGRYFDCDTDFHLNEKISVEDLIAETTERHICLTGGEPLAHQRAPWFAQLVEFANKKFIQIHVETSGTIEPEFSSPWYTIAPKYGWTSAAIKMASEIKFLVDENFDINLLPPFDREFTHVFLCPINHEHSVNLENVQRCMNLLKDHPTWRLSAQWHKFIGVR